MVWDNFKSACRARGISATNALKELGISQSMPSCWKKGMSPREDTVRRMADYLGISTGELIDGSKVNLPKSDSAVFKRNFESLCAKKGVSPTHVLTSIGLSDSVYSNWTEKTVPRKTTLLKLSEYFGVTVDDLLAKDSIDEPQKENPPAEAGGTDINLSDYSDYPEYIKRCVETALLIPPERREEFLRVAQEIAKTFEPRR